MARKQREFSRTVKADFERLLRQSLNEASGFAECLGLENLAQYLHFVSLDDLTAPEYRNTDICTNRQGKEQKIIEEPQGMRYTGNSGASRTRKTEVKKMTVYGRTITGEDLRNIADYMNDEIREELHAKLAPCTTEEFLREYIKRDPEILEILRNEFDFRAEIEDKF